VLAQTGENRAIFSCPTASPFSAWDTNANPTLGAPHIVGAGQDAWGISKTTLFSIGYNDWGAWPPGGSILPGWVLRLHAFGLGGAVDVFGEIRESQILAPFEMILAADSKPGNGGKVTRDSTGAFDAIISPRNVDSMPSNRHDSRTVIVFCDGHTEAPRRNEVVDPNNERWHRRWNNNHELSEYSWTVDQAAAAQRDP
jgi:prepilin-type processing-associated H-X9-DG protein